MKVGARCHLYLHAVVLEPVPVQPLDVAPRCAIERLLADIEVDRARGLLDRWECASETADDVCVGLQRPVGPDQAEEAFVDRLVARWR